MNRVMGKWVVALCFVIALVLATNLVDRSNFSQVSNSLETIYEDRLVAKDLIFDISMLIHEKSLALATTDSSFYMQRESRVNENIDQLIDIFSKTKLTEEEELAFQRLQTDLGLLSQFESRDTDAQVEGSPYFSNETTSGQMEVILNDLKVLSKIQIEEGKRQMLIGKAAVNAVNFHTELEIYVLIAAGIVVQVLLIHGFRYKNKRNIANTGNWMEN